MKKYYILITTLFLSASIAHAAATAFDSMDKAVEVKLSPQIKTQPNTTKPTVQTPAVSQKNTVQLQKYTDALVNLDDAQVELRQELTDVTAKYNNALVEKERATQNCKNFKKQIKAINKKMKNVDKSKKMINANLQNEK